MAKKLDPMDLKQIISLRLDGFSNRQIGETLGISRNTVNGYIQLFKASELDFKELLELDQASLEELFPSRTTINNPRFAALMHYFDKVNLARNHPGFTSALRSLRSGAVRSICLRLASADTCATDKCRLEPRNL